MVPESPRKKKISFFRRFLNRLGVSPPRFSRSQSLPRTAYFPRIVSASPVNFLSLRRGSDPSLPVQHNFPSESSFGCVDAMPPRERRVDTVTAGPSAPRRERATTDGYNAPPSNTYAPAPTRNAQAPAPARNTYDTNSSRHRTREHTYAPAPTRNAQAPAPARNTYDTNSSRHRTREHTYDHSSSRLRIAEHSYKPAVPPKEPSSSRKGKERARTDKPTSPTPTSHLSNISTPIALSSGRYRSTNNGDWQEWTPPTWARTEELCWWCGVRPVRFDQTGLCKVYLYLVCPVRVWMEGFGGGESWPISQHGESSKQAEYEHRFSSGRYDYS
ncbi:hypothetical protein RUND412_007925 [Rhizina undulata]